MTYKDHLETVPAILNNFNSQIQHLIINLALSGESSNIERLFAVEEEVLFKYEDFKESDDPNVKILYSIFNYIQDQNNFILNLNALEDGSAVGDDEDPF